VGRYDTSGYAMAVAVADNYAYVAESSVGLQVIDVSNPANPVHAGRYEFEGGGLHRVVAVSGNYAYLADEDRHVGLQVIDVSNPANPVRVGGYKMMAGMGLAVAGNHVYVADEGLGSLQVIDVSNPANPVRAGGYGRFGYETIVYDSDIAVVDNLIYMADGWRGLLILELSRPPWIEVAGLNPFTFRLSSEPGATLRVQRSSNLQDWEDWQTVTLGDAPVELSNPDAAPTSARFFRALQP
jgi:hypothetical protein